MTSIIFSFDILDQIDDVLVWRKIRHLLVSCLTDDSRSAVVCSAMHVIILDIEYTTLVHNIQANGGAAGSNLSVVILFNV